MLHKDDQGEADQIRDAIRSSSFGIAFNAASFACICKELQLLEDGVRDLLPDCLDLIPVVGEHCLCPSDAELRSMADRFRSLESRILTMLREDLPATVSFEFRQANSWSKPLTPLPEQVKKEPEKKPMPRLSRPMRVNVWHKLFLKAKYSDNLSESYFRTFLKEHIAAGKAKRESEKGPVQFDLDYLTEIGVELDEK